MKYRLKKDLPFMKQDSIFGTGCWSGGFGIDRGKDIHGSHNGIEVFEAYENEVLTSILNNPIWIEKIPQNKHEKLTLYENKEITREQFLAQI